MADAGLRHDRDRHGSDNAVDEVRVAHPGHAALSANVSGDALEGHDGHGTRVLRDLRLVRGDDIHDHPALEHLGETALHARRTRLGRDRRNRVSHPPILRRPISSPSLVPYVTTQCFINVFWHD